jgi:hypothetical protein
MTIPRHMHSLSHTKFFEFRFHKVGCLEIPRWLRFTLRPATIISILLLRHPALSITSLPTLRLHGSSHLQLGLFTRVMSRPYCRNKINRETPHIESINERNNPLTYCSRSVMFFISEDAERDCKAELDEDEG